MNQINNENSKISCIRLIKKTKGMFGLPEIIIDADFPCEVIQEDQYFYELETEYVVFLRHAKLNDACLATVTVTLRNDVKIQHVVSEKEYVPFIEKEQQISFEMEISRLIGATTTLSIHTLMRNPGQTLRLEHNQPSRNVGKYMENYPKLQIQAVMHYMFATREIITHSRLGEQIHEKKLGHLLVLGFETNNPLHTDFPPHWHLILRWPYRTGSQAPHIYVNEDGLNVNNRVSIDGIPKVTHTYQANEWCHLKDFYGRTKVGIRVDDTGGYSLKTDVNTCYSVSPYGNNLVNIYLNGQYLKSLQVIDDVATGQTLVKTMLVMDDDEYSLQEEIIKYDPLTGEKYYN